MARLRTRARSQSQGSFRTKRCGDVKSNISTKRKVPYVSRARWSCLGTKVIECDVIGTRLQSHESSQEFDVDLCAEDRQGRSQRHLAPSFPPPLIRSRQLQSSFDGQIVTLVAGRYSQDSSSRKIRCFISPEQQKSRYGTSHSNK